VRSLVGRFLEHARVFYFENHGGEPLILAGSADWMPRNFFRRIEVLFPIEEPPLRRWIVDELFPIELQDNENARVLHANGAYVPVARSGEPAFSAQAYFVAAAAQRAKLAAD
jgi:polyphosphate kinase